MTLPFNDLIKDRRGGTVLVVEYVGLTLLAVLPGDAGIGGTDLRNRWLFRAQHALPNW